jgi:hypothetical protein
MNNIFCYKCNEPQIKSFCFSQLQKILIFSFYTIGNLLLNFTID